MVKASIVFNYQIISTQQTHMATQQNSQGIKQVFATALTCMLVWGAVNAAEESDYYAIDTFPTEDLPMEVGAMTLMSDGNLLIGTRRGDVYVLENAYGNPDEAVFRPWARGLAQPLGFLEHKGWIYTAQRGELTRIKDSDGDGEADVFETVCDAWDISGNYHEYNFGPRMDKEGFMWVTLNKPFGGQPYADPDIKQAHWRGWAVRVNPDTGEMFPMAAGLRSPAGVEDSPWGDIFYTDNQGEWCNASKLSHLEFGDYHGHPWGLPTQKLAGSPFDKMPQPVSGTWMKDMHQQIPEFKMPAVWFPYEKMGKSPSGLRWDLTEGKFGPFQGQLFVADQHHATVMRVFLEKVDGHWQGACLPFREGFQCGIIRICFGKDASLFVGMSNAGWGGRGNRPWGLQRLRWTGEVPFEVKEMKAKPDGFELSFTQPVDPATAGKADAYRMESYTYKLESRYGGPEDDKKQVEITGVKVSDDGMRVRLTISPIRAGYVHELIMNGLTNKDGVPLLHGEAYYTLVNIPSDAHL
jgi:glucose/arabinose dehydrogenase